MVAVDKKSFQWMETQKVAGRKKGEGEVEKKEVRRNSRVNSKRAHWEEIMSDK